MPFQHYPMRPMTPKSYPPAATPAGYWIEPKINGWHIVFRGDGTVWTRHGHEITPWQCFKGMDLNFKYPVVAEIVNAAEMGNANVPGLANGGQAVIIAFDIMMPKAKIEERYKILTTAPLKNLPHWSVIPRFEAKTWAEVNEMVKVAKANGGEGVVLKERGSLYHVGKTASIERPSWLKLKQLVPLEKCK